MIEIVVVPVNVCSVIVTVDVVREITTFDCEYLPVKGAVGNSVLTTALIWVIESVGIVTSV